MQLLYGLKCSHLGKGLQAFSLHGINESFFGTLLELCMIAGT
jgi:hypothetical protein